MILFLSDVAGSEILLILVFILIFFGSKSIPGIARTFGRTIRQIKDASQELQDEIKKSGVDIKNDLNLSSIIRETAQDVQKPFERMVDDLDESINYEPQKNYFVQQQQLEKEVKPETNLPLDQQTVNTTDSTLEK
jgi:sec-independent protein translocase protein TatA